VRSTRIAFLIRSLGRGGAERQLIELARGLALQGHEILILTFYEGGVLAQELENQERITLCHAGKRGRWDLLGFWSRIYQPLKEFQPEIVHSYLSSANIAAVFLKPFLREAKIVWGIRSSDMDLSAYDGFSRALWRWEIFCSRFADSIIANSEEGKRVVIEAGFPSDKVSVVQNGIDTARFSRDREAGIQIRKRYGLSQDLPVIGFVSRRDPMKDIATFWKSLTLIEESGESFQVLLVGLEKHQDDDEFLKKLKKTKIVFAGEQDELSPYYSAMDIYVSSSMSEGFPNTVAEAMACCLPCVVTDVGDSRLMLAGGGKAVPRKDFSTMASALRALLLLSTDQRMEMGEKNRSRILNLYNLRNLVERTEKELSTLLQEEEILALPEETKSEIG
jgi:glycosyltransferase involved in cell wall biosynthesis